MIIHDLVEDRDLDRCDECRRYKADQVGLTLIETDELEAEDFGFCSLACLVLFVRSRYIEVAS